MASCKTREVGGICVRGLRQDERLGVCAEAKLCGTAKVPGWVGVRSCMAWFRHDVVMIMRISTNL